MEEKMQVYIPWGVCVCTCTTTSFLLRSGQVLESHPWITRAQGQESVLVLISVWGECSCLLVELWEQQSLQSHDATDLTRQFLSFNGYQCFQVFFFLHIFLQPLSDPLCPSVLPGAAQILQSSHFTFSHLWHFAFTGQMRQIIHFKHYSLLSAGLRKTWLTKTPRILSLLFPPSSSPLFQPEDIPTMPTGSKNHPWAFHTKAANEYFYLNSCSLTTSPRYSMINCPAFRGSLVRIPHPFSSARNLSRHCTHSCLWMRWLQHCSPQGQVLGEHSAKIILKETTEKVKGGEECPLGFVMQGKSIINQYMKSR